MEDERDIKRHFVNGVDVLEVPTVTISRAWSLESGSGSDETGTGMGAEIGQGTETGFQSQSQPSSNVQSGNNVTLGAVATTTAVETGEGEAGVHSRKSFENP